MELYFIIIYDSIHERNKKRHKIRVTWFYVINIAIIVIYLYLQENTIIKQYTDNKT